MDIASDLKDPDYDRLHNDETGKWRTGELFRFCIGRQFVVHGFGRYGHIELWAGEDRGVRRKFGSGHSIWIEPEFLKRVRKPRKLSS